MKGIIMEHIFSYVMFLVLEYLIYELYVNLQRGLEYFFAGYASSYSWSTLTFVMNLEGIAKLEKKNCFTCIYIFYFFYQHAGFLFPERTEGSEAIFTPAQTQPLQNYPASVRAEHRDRESQASAKPDEPLMRLVIASIMSCVPIIVVGF